MCIKGYSDDGVAQIMATNEINQIKQRTNLPNVSLSIYATALLDQIKQSPPSLVALRRIVRNHQLPDNIEFDPVIHADLNFTENLFLHW
jgi:hypothetical protein